MTYQDVSIELDDGLSMVSRDYAGDGPALLCLHGLTRNSADFAALIDELEPSNRAIVPDQRGRGRSSWDPDSSRYQVPAYVADTWQLIDELGEDRVVVIGTSMGGLMGMMMAVQHPDRVAGLVLNDIGPVVEPEGIARIQRYVGAVASFPDWNAACSAVQNQNGHAFPDFDQSAWMRFTQNLCIERSDSSVALNYDPAISEPIAASKSAAVPPDLWPMFEAISAPMLLLRGETSDILHRGTAIEMQARQPAMGYVQINNRGHAPILNEPEALRAIDRFIASID